MSTNFKYKRYEQKGYKKTKYFIRLEALSDYLTFLKNKDEFYLHDLEQLRSAYKRYHNIRKECSVYPPMRQLCIDERKNYVAIINDICKRNNINMLAYNDKHFAFTKSDKSISFYIDKIEINIMLEF